MLLFLTRRRSTGSVVLNTCAGKTALAALIDEYETVCGTLQVLNWNNVVLGYSLYIFELTSGVFIS